MAQPYEISPNLIHQLQISLNKQAAIDSLTSGNRHSTDDNDVDNSSYLNDAIVGPNSSSGDVLRCRSCSGELLRDSESFICIYCGVSQNRDFFRRHPLSFKSTFAFQWFLQSFGLDGFENVGDENEGTQSGDRGRRSVNEEGVSLSDFLDVKLEWADDDDDDSRGFGVRKDGKVSGKRYMSLVGVDVEEILAQDRRDRDGSSVGVERAVVGESVENERSGISGKGSLSLFDNMQSSEVASRSGEGGNDESCSDWGADFQSVFPGSGEVQSVNSYVSDAPSRSFLTAFNSKVSEGNSLIEGTGKGVDSNVFFEGLPTDQQLTNEGSRNDEKIDGVDSIDEWGDFSMLTSDKITRSEPSNTAMPGVDISGGLVVADTCQDFIGAAVSKGIHLQSNTLRMPDDARNTFVTPHTGGEIPFGAINSESEQHVGTGNSVFAGEHQPTPFNGYRLPAGGAKSIAPGTTNELDDSSAMWNFLNGFDNQLRAANREVDDSIVSADPWNDFAVLGVGEKEEQGKNLEVAVGKGNGNQSDSLAFDSWSDFTISGVSDSKPTSTDISSGAWNDFSSLLVTEVNQPQSSNTKASENQAVLDDDNIFSPWSGFRSSGTQTVNSLVGRNDAKTNTDPVSFHKDSITSNSLKMIEDNTTFSSWGDFGGATSSLEQKLQAAGGSSENKLSSGGGDMFSAFGSSVKKLTNSSENQFQCDGVKMLDDKSTCENDDSFDVWSDFTSSSNASGNHGSSAKAPDYNEANKNGDTLDAWDVLVSSPNEEAAKDTAVAMGKTLEFNLFSSSVNSQYVGPDNLMQPDISVRMVSDQNGSAPIPLAPSEGPDMVRTEHGDDKADGYIATMKPNESTSKDRVAETLISEMHDLSFMLESGLSIPNSGT